MFFREFWGIWEKKFEIYPFCFVFSRIILKNTFFVGIKNIIPSVLEIDVKFLNRKKNYFTSRYNSNALIGV